MIVDCLAIQKVMMKNEDKTTNRTTEMKARYVTFHVQKSKLITLGTCVHLYLDCPSLMRTNAKKIDISGCDELVQSICKCNYCYERKTK